jgi:hypothetical protein
MGLLLSGDLLVASIGAAGGVFMLGLGSVVFRSLMLADEAAQREKDFYAQLHLK